MKKTLLLLVFVSISLSLFSQVGIGTETPTAMLDVSGKVRIRNVPVDNSPIISDSIMVVDGNGYVQAASASSISNLISFVRAKASSSASLLNVTLLSGWNKIAFDSEDIDYHDDYDSTTDYVFTAPRKGVYSIYARYEVSVSSLLSASIVSLGIFKKVGTANPTLVIDNSATVAALLGTTVNTREVQTLLELNAGEKIYFGAQTPLNLTVLSSSASKSYFTIIQVR